MVSQIKWKKNKAKCHRTRKKVCSALFSYCHIKSNINVLLCILKIVWKLGKCLTCACASSGSMHIVVIPPIYETNCLNHLFSRQQNTAGLTCLPWLHWWSLHSGINEPTFRKIWMLNKRQSWPHQWKDLLAWNHDKLLIISKGVETELQWPIIFSSVK